jgi:predicted RND superfamily exporter protein
MDAIAARSPRCIWMRPMACSVHQTGEVPLADEEFGSIREGMGLIGAVMVVAMLGCLWLAVRSGRMVAAIMVTIVTGLVITLALGLLAVGRLNVISVAFIPLFVGLGVDFGIQFAVRFNAERRANAQVLPALEATAARWASR